MVHNEVTNLSISYERNVNPPASTKFLSHKNLVSIGAMEEWSSRGGDNAVYFLLFYCSSSVQSFCLSHKNLVSIGAVEE